MFGIDGTSLRPFYLFITLLSLAEKHKTPLRTQNSGELEPLRSWEAPEVTLDTDAGSSTGERRFYFF